MTARHRSTGAIVAATLAIGCVAGCASRLPSGVDAADLAAAATDGVVVTVRVERVLALGEGDALDHDVDPRISHVLLVVGPGGVRSTRPWDAWNAGPPPEPGSVITSAPSDGLRRRADTAPFGGR